VLREVSDRVAVAEGLVIPDTVPFDLADSIARRSWNREMRDLAAASVLTPVG